MVRQIAVLEGSHSNPAGGLLHLIRFYDLIFHNLFPDKFGDVPNELLQTHDAARPGFEGLAILAVHGTEAQELQLRLRPDNTCLPGGPEDLLKMQALALIRQVEDLIRMEIPLPLN